MGRKVRVFLGESEIARLLNKKDCPRPNQSCFFCDLIDCQDIRQNGEKKRIGRVRLYGKDVPVYFSPQEGCWLPYNA